MGVECQILLNKPKGGVHRPGQVVRGKAKYSIEEPTQFQDVTLSFLGQGQCVWKEGPAKYRVTFRGKEDYVINHLNICNKSTEDTISLEGNYEQPFEFLIPEDIPRTYKDNVGCISYRIELKFVKPNVFSTDKVFKAEIPIHSYLNPTIEEPLIYELKKELFAPFASETPVIDLKAQMGKSILTPGENAQINYQVTNDTNVEISSVKSELYCYKTYTADCGNIKNTVAKVEKCETKSSSIPANQVSEFVCTFPILPKLCSIINSKVITVEYRVRVTLRLPIPHLDAQEEIPVLIGEVKREEDSTLEVEDGEDDPPTYWEAMNDTKKTDKSGTDSD